MARPATTNETRKLRTAERAIMLRDAVNVAMASDTDPDVTATERMDLWKEVATLAGNIQRDTRQLAGLGRGG